MSKYDNQSTLLDALYRAFLARYDAEEISRDNALAVGDKLNARKHRGRLRCMDRIDDQFQEIARDERRLNQKRRFLGESMGIVLSEWK